MRTNLRRPGRGAGLDGSRHPRRVRFLPQPTLRRPQGSAKILARRLP